MLKVSKVSLNWQMLSSALQTEKLQGEMSDEELVKYVLLTDVDPLHPAVRKQQTPKPLAQFPPFDPPRAVHSELV
jgi:hypothetical protein